MAIDLSDYETGEKLAGDYDAELAAVQERLARVQVAHKVHGKRSIVLLEGWDAAGKGGAIQRLTAKWDPRNFRVWPIGAPTVEEKARHFLWRFWTRMPGRGEIAVFDRSWYGRVLVERVEGLCSEAEWKRAYDEINAFEAQQKDDGVAVLKLFVHVTQEEQDRRLKARIEDDWKRWKVNAEDFRNRARRADYLRAIDEMFAETNRRWAPWQVIDGNDKKSARIAALTYIADRLEKHVPMKPPSANPEVVELGRALFGKDLRVD